MQAVSQAYPYYPISPLKIPISDPIIGEIRKEKPWLRFKAFFHCKSKLYHEIRTLKLDNLKWKELFFNALSSNQFWMMRGFLRAAIFHMSKVQKKELLDAL